MKNTVAILLLTVIYACNTKQAVTVEDNTFCNPLNLDYRFSVSGASYREAADPIIILYKGDYYLFASHSGGYWWSNDFREWTLVEPTGLNIEKFAPSVWFSGDTMYYTSSENGDIYKTLDPKKGVWEYVSHPYDWSDPWIFVDDDGKMYAYYGCSHGGTIDCVQLDPQDTFKVIGEPVHCIFTDTLRNGYELQGDNNEGGLPWTEGAAMLKHNGKYYLTYATPGTEFRSYCDGYYISDSPMGPFKPGANNPVTRKSLGYVTGVGHGGLFYDKSGKLWTIDCVVISNKAMFERRLAVFPVDIDADGLLHANTVFGDYPQYLPGVATDPCADNSPHWNLLSKGKTVTVSSNVGSQENAVDEDIKTHWSAASGDAGEWLMVDLGKECTVNALQTNFYESETTYNEGRKTGFTTKYRAEYSGDSKNWKTLFDKSDAKKDTPHDYVQLTIPVTARYVKITNMGEVAGYGRFAVNELRIFGNGGDEVPQAVPHFTAKRLEDRRIAEIRWDKVENADGYIVRYGIAPDKLWNHYQVWSDTSLTVRSLVVDQEYYFRIDACNDSGVAEGKEVLKL
ncbi:MAG: family 43 glycosylhydrolase [Tannerella sp.]|nr:family 43 glycosylhydrolase [Tannerella sp.]